MSYSPPPRPRLRSLLFVPGTRTDLLPKAVASGADAVILDLEDAVPAAGSRSALEQVTHAVEQFTTRDHFALFVRVKPLDGWEAAETLRAVAGPGLSGIMLPKVTGPDDIRFADELLSWCEQERGLREGHFALVPLLESASALHAAHACATASSRVAYAGAVTGAGGDVERAVGYRWSPEGAETHALRSRVLLDVRAAGAPHPVAGLWTRMGDLEGLRAFAADNRALGYTGMLAIHPSHVPVINEAFAATPEELARARRLLDVFDQARRDGAGAVDFEGDMVDEAMAETARQLLEQG
ncbi:CoA ester lyase [Streptomyces sp. NBC_00038]|uniref:HpcH/HpaI aldolase/citrate lyase family protein n=1 Tax=Streptomyces sp. NBC_00038 TaxID=2903615 RepID=UPI00225B828F|nr:CoA ester lyase [Streptomyces sp. NBC_00038]MCX5554529.1 CoA ester lyase [Streptomyces sp. NBC_00038]